MIDYTSVVMEKRYLLEVYTYNAGKGDCVRIHYGGTHKHNILIDSEVLSFAGRFAAICEQIQKSGEIIDLLVITHMDEDHLGGALIALSGSRFRPKINEVWMNANVPSEKSALSPYDAHLSVGQNNKLYSIFLDRGIKVTPVSKGTHKWIDSAELKVIWPTQNVVDETYLRSSKTVLARKRDFGYSLKALADKSLLTVDSSPSNGASVVFIFTYENKRFLFTGDAHGDDIIRYLPKDKHFDLVKLPHHGSARNITEEWKEIDCHVFMTCTDGKSHPDKQTIAKLLKWNQEIFILSPSSWWENGFWLPEDEKYRNRLCCKNVDGEAIHF